MDKWTNERRENFYFGIKQRWHTKIRMRIPRRSRDGIQSEPYALHFKNGCFRYKVCRYWSYMNRIGMFFMAYQIYHIYSIEFIFLSYLFHHSVEEISIGENQYTPYRGIACVLAMIHSWIELYGRNYVYD